MAPDIVLVVLDSVRARNLPFLGYPRPTMPVFADIAREGVVFAGAYATSNWSLPSHASILSGRLPRGHRVSHANRRLPPDVPTLPEILGAAGYRTAVFTANPYISDTFAMLRGFEHRVKSWQVVQTGVDVTLEQVLEDSPDRWPGARAYLRAFLRRNVLANLANHLYGENLSRRRDAGGARLVRAAHAWLRSGDRHPIFAVFNFMEAHLPYRPPDALARLFVPDAPPQELAAGRALNAPLVNGGVDPLTDRQREIVRGLYDGALRLLDGYLERLVGHLRARRGRDTVVIVIADHGDLLGEDGLIGHEFSLADPLIHVPLVVWAPGLISGGLVRHGLVQAHDVFATILGLAGIVAPPDTDAIDLLADGAARPHVFAEYDRPLVSLRGMLAAVPDPPRLALLDRGLAAARTARHKLLVGTDGSEALYDLADDPAEARDLAGTPEEPPGVRDALRAVVRASSAQALAEPAEPEIDDETRRALERFGYLT